MNSNAKRMSQLCMRMHRDLYITLAIAWEFSSHHIRNAVIMNILKYDEVVFFQA